MVKCPKGKRFRAELHFFIIILKLCVDTALKTHFQCPMCDYVCNKDKDKHAKIAWRSLFEHALHNK